MSAAGLVALRNELYALMRRALIRKDAAPLEGIEARLLSNLLYAPHEQFLRDKAPRYRQALKSWSAAPRPRSKFAQALAFSELLFNHHLFFDTHEYLEEPWRGAKGLRRTCLHGLIQIGAGFHKLELDPRASSGALELLEKGLSKVREAREVLGPGAAYVITLKLEPVLAALREGRFRLDEAPRLRWSRA